MRVPLRFLLPAGSPVGNPSFAYGHARLRICPQLCLCNHRQEVLHLCQERCWVLTERPDFISPVASDHEEVDCHPFVLDKRLRATAASVPVFDPRPGVVAKRRKASDGCRTGRGVGTSTRR